MKIETIKELIGEFKSSNLTRLKINAEGFELELEREKEVVYPVAGMPVAMTSPAQVNATEVTINTADSTPVADKSNKVITSPMVGTFYSAHSPTSKPFVGVGTKVKKGDVVCIIEAMKLMNEVEADQDGEVVEILVGNEDMVEFGQPLFVLR